MPVSQPCELPDADRREFFRRHVVRAEPAVIAHVVVAFGFDNDLLFAKYLVQDIGIACVPGSSFYNDPRDGARQVRFAFCKREETLNAAAERFRKLRKQ